MPTRVTMNSRALQENSPDVYREFFSKCEVVVSAPRSFFWFGDNVNRLGGLTIRQKIPLRTYVGLQSTPEPSFTFEAHQTFVPSAGQFRFETRRVLQQHTISSFLTDLCQSHGRTQGFRVSILHELPLGAGLGTYGPTATALTTAVFLKLGLITETDIHEWERHSWHQLEGPARQRFDAVFRCAWRLESMYKGDVASGCSPFTAFWSSSQPILFSSQLRSDDGQSDSGRVHNDSGNQYAIVSTFRYWGGRLADVFGLRRPDTWSVDFGLIYTGSSMAEEFAVRTHHDIQQKLRLVVQTIQTLVDHSISSELQPWLQFVQQSIHAGRDGLWESYVSAINATAVEGAVALRHMFDRNSTADGINQFFASLRRLKSFLRLYEPTTPTDNLVYYLYQWAAKEETTASIKILGAGNGGDLLFVTPLYALEDSMDAFLKSMRRRIDKRVWLDYASWIDGIEDRGVVIEQDLTAGRTSSLLSGGAVIIRTWTAGRTSDRVVSLDRFDRLRSTFDLLLDPSDRTIVLRGQELTSKELHSRKATIAILDILLRNIGKEVAGTAFPATYADRTTMQGKIVGPLCEVFEAKTKKPLPLTVRGGLNKRFTLKFDIDGLTIGMVTKKL